MTDLTEVRCWVCPDSCPVGDCRRDDRAVSLDVEAER